MVCQVASTDKINLKAVIWLGGKNKRLMSII